MPAQSSHSWEGLLHQPAAGALTVPRVHKVTGVVEHKVASVEARHAAQELVGAEVPDLAVEDDLQAVGMELALAPIGELVKVVDGRGHAEIPQDVAPEHQLVLVPKVGGALVGPIKARPHGARPGGAVPPSKVLQGLHRGREAAADVKDEELCAMVPAGGNRGNDSRAKAVKAAVADVLEGGLAL